MITFRDDEVLCFWHSWFAKRRYRVLWGDASTAVTKGKHPLGCASGYILDSAEMLWNSNHACSLWDQTATVHVLYRPGSMMWLVILCPKMDTGEIYHFPFIRLRKGHIRFGLLQYFTEKFFPLGRPILVFNRHSKIHDSYTGMEIDGKELHLLYNSIFYSKYIYPTWLLRPVDCTILIHPVVRKETWPWLTSGI